MNTAKKVFVFLFGTHMGQILSILLFIGLLILIGVLDSLGVPAWGAFIPLICLLGLLVGTLTMALASLVMNLAGADIDGAEIAENLTVDASGQEILRRWIVRSRWHRYVGGLAGFAFAVGLGSHYLVCSLGGLFIGSVVGLTARLGRVVKGKRSADITPRLMKTYVAPGQQYVLYALVILAGVSLVMAVGVRDSSHVPSSTAVWGWPALVLAVVIGVVAAQRRVVTRPRPAMADRLRSSDDLLRYLANTRSLADPALALGFVLMGETLGAWGGPETGAEASQFIFHLVGIGYWWQNRRLGLDQLRDVKPIGFTQRRAANA